MPDDFLRLFQHETEVVTLAPGEELFKKGDPGDHVYVVKSGALQVLDGNQVFETLGPGGIVGEMALVSDSPRSATAKAVGETVVIPVDEKRFLFMVQRTPLFALRVMRVMSERLRAMNERISVSAD